MPCMCGDLYCWSCGPAQGNSRCPICGEWEADGGCVNPAACDAEAQRQNEEYVKQLAEEERLAREFWAEEAKAQAERAAQPCPHGRPIHECNDCMVASDIAYDAAREQRAFR